MLCVDQKSVFHYDKRVKPSGIPGLRPAIGETSVGEGQSPDRDA